MSSLQGCVFNYYFILLDQIKNLFELVRNKILEDIEMTSWMHSHMKEITKEKIRKLSGDFVGSDLYFNETFMAYRYSGVRPILGLI